MGGAIRRSRIHRVRSLSPVVMAALVPALACGPAPPEGPPRPTLDSLQERVFNPSCAKVRCHADTTAESGLSLAPGDSWDALVNVPSTQIPGLMLVEPYRPEESYLVMKLEGRSIVGEMMPQGRPPLAPEEIEAIRAWIARGARGP